MKTMDWQGAPDEEIRRKRMWALIHAADIANSANFGACLCVGTWGEGGKGMGRDPIETALAFGAKKKLFKIHFRNVTRVKQRRYILQFLERSSWTNLIGHRKCGAPTNSNQEQRDNEVFHLFSLRSRGQAPFS